MDKRLKKVMAIIILIFAVWLTLVFVAITLHNELIFWASFIVIAVLGNVLIYKISTKEARAMIKEAWKEEIFGKKKEEKKK
jgi:Flp pilus assembly protein TadB